jgi:hypothetical protein
MEKTVSGFVTVATRAATGGRLLIDDKLACATPCRAEVAPGKRNVRVEKEGMEDYEQSIEVPQTSESTIDIRFRPRPPRTREISTAVVALLLFGGGAYVGHLSDSNKDAIAADIKAGQHIDNEDPRFLHGKLEAIGADVLYGLGTIVALSAIYGVIFSHGPESTGAVDQRMLGLGPTAGPGGGGGLAAWGRF